MIAGLDLETVLHGGDCRPDKGDMDSQHRPGVPGKELRGATGGSDQISRNRESHRRAALAALFVDLEDLRVHVGPLEWIHPDHAARLFALLALNACIWTATERSLECGLVFLSLDRVE